MTRRRSHNRAQEIRLIPLNELAFDGRETDQILVGLAQREYRGKITSSLTRLDERKIFCGFFRRTGGAVEAVSDPPDRFIDSLVAAIKGGSRPRIYVYWNVLSPHESKFVAPDEQAVLTAYRRVGIRYVPVHLLLPKKETLEESAITFRGLDAQAPTGVIAKQRELYASILGDSEHSADSMGSLIERCSQTLSAIRTFHVEGGSPVHYHQALFAVVARHRRCLNSIQSLLNLGNVDHAFALVRLLYEGMLGFYVDWLSPDFFGPRIQYISSYRKSLNRRGDKQSTLRPPEEIMGGLAELLTSVRRKAEISPLGAYFHEIAYSSLSSMVHQDYGELDFEMGDFVDALGNADWQANATVRWSDAITAELLLRINDDIGQG